MKQYHWYGRVPITTTLVFAIGTLVFLATGTVFGVGVWLAQKNTFDLLNANASQIITTDVKLIEHHLKPAEHQASFIADLLSRNEIDPTDRSQFGTLLTGALAAAPQIESIVYISNELNAFGMSRITTKGEPMLSIVEGSKIKKALEGVNQGVKDPRWLPPIWHDVHQKTYLSRAQPVVRNDEVIGIIVAEIATDELSRFISMKEFETSGNPFILYGFDHVLAHSQMVDGYPNLSVASPLPRLDQFIDPIVSSIWSSEARRETENHVFEAPDTHLIEVSGQEYVFIFKTLMNFGSEPMIVGAYFRSSDLPAEVKRMISALVAGLMILLLSLMTALVLGQRIARPIVDLSTAVGRIRDLDVSMVEELPASLFREINDQSTSFNAMLRALRWFELYVPKTIVDQLIRSDEVDSSLSVTQEVTVMFTDVVGFSAISEGMRIEEVAGFVNHHFSIVVQCIEKEGGTVDKFIGDAVMAYWESSDLLVNCSERACRAGLEIAKAIRQDNRHRQLNNEPAVGIRIGIHTGLATVGNIGTPGRMNYTIIGDTVNIGQRLEQLGKQLCSADHEVSILISGDTAEKLSPEFNIIGVGSHSLQGRAAAIDVYRLE